MSEYARVRENLSAEDLNENNDNFILPKKTSKPKKETKHQKQHNQQIRLTRNFRKLT